MQTNDSDFSKYEDSVFISSACSPGKMHDKCSVIKNSEKLACCYFDSLFQ